MIFDTGISGLHAAASHLDVVGNNIANSSTVGFKGSRANFGDIYSFGGCSTLSAPPGDGGAPTARSPGAAPGALPWKSGMDAPLMNRTLVSRWKKSIMRGPCVRNASTSASS